MKKLVAIFLILMFLCGCASNVPAEESTTAATESLPETETQTLYLLKRMHMADAGGMTILSREYQYSELGWKTEELEYNETGSLDCRTVFSYNAEGLCVAQEISYMDDGQTVSVTVIHRVYDDQGRAVRIQYYEDGQLGNTTTLTYDDHGNCLTNNTEAVGFLSYTYEYDARGNVVKKEEFMDGDLIYTVTCRYDEQNRCVEEITANFEGVVETRTVSVCENNTETTTCYDGEGILFLTLISVYDDQGNLIRQENYYSDSSAIISEYVYEAIEISR